MTYERQFFQYLENLKRRIYAQPLNLGGVSSSGGGVGGPPGGFIGKLPQSKVTFDKLEAAVDTIPASGASLLDNLNRIRYDIANISGVGGQITVQEDDIVVASGVTTVNFEGGVSVVDEGSNKVTVTITASGTGTSTFIDLTDTPNSYAGEAGRVIVVNAGEDALEYANSFTYKQEDLTSQIPASGDNFSLSYTPVSGAISIHYNGITQQFNNFTILNSGVHTKFSPVSGDELLVEYHYGETLESRGITVVTSGSVSIPGVNQINVEGMNVVNEGGGIITLSGSSAGGGYAGNSNIFAYLSADQEDIVHGTVTTVELDTLLWDTGNEFNTTTHEFTANATGYYQVNFCTRFASRVGNDGYVQSRIMVDSALVLFAEQYVSTGNYGYSGNSGVVSLTAGAKLSLACVHNSSNNGESVTSNQAVTNLSIYRIA